MTDADAEAVARAVAGDGHVVVDDVGAAARAVAHELGAELLDGPGRLDDVLEALDLRALALDERDAGGPEPLDPVGLRRLGGRVLGATALVDRAGIAVRTRAAASQSVVVHPEGLRDSAAAVLAARDEVAQAQDALDDILSPLPWDPASTPDATGPLANGTVAAPSGQSGAGGPRGAGTDGSAWSPDDRRAARMAVITLVLSVIASAAVYAGGGGTLGLIISLLALVWVGWEVWRLRRHSTDSHQTEAEVTATLDLAARTADQAYGGVDIDSVEARTARRALRRVEARLGAAEAAWSALVGPDVDAADIDDVIRVRDAQASAIPSAAVDSSATVLAARRQHARAVAAWRALFWLLDEPVRAAEDLDEVVEDLSARGLLRVPPAVVVPDEAGTLGPDATPTSTEADVRVVIVAPAPGGGGDGV